VRTADEGGRGRVTDVQLLDFGEAPELFLSGIIVAIVVTVTGDVFVAERVGYAHGRHNCDWKWQCVWPGPSCHLVLQGEPGRRGVINGNHPADSVGDAGEKVRHQPSTEQLSQLNYLQTRLSRAVAVDKVGRPTLRCLQRSAFHSPSRRDRYPPAWRVHR